jgi:UDP-glucose 4,6-dehydratase
MNILKTYKIDTVLHLAAESFVDRSFHHSLEFTATNVFGTHILLQSCLETYYDPVTKSFGTLRLFVHTSTDEVYGTQKDNSPANPYCEETSMTVPTNPYAGTKCGAEYMVQSYIKSFQFPALIVRPNNVFSNFGECRGQFVEKAIPKFLCLALQDKPISLHGTGQARRSFMHVVDLARAFELLIFRGKLGQVYNVGIDKDMTMSEVAHRVLELVDSRRPAAALTTSAEARIQYVRDRAFNDERYFVSSDKIRQLGWQPIFTFQQGLIMALEWYQHNMDTFPPDVMNSALVPHPQVMK